MSILMIPGLEKCVTGLLRICTWNVHREDVSNKVLGSLKENYQNKIFKHNFQVPGEEDLFHKNYS